MIKKLSAIFLASFFSFLFLLTSVTNAQSTFQGDLNNDGTVNIFDYNILLGDFGKTGAAGFTPADINRDGKVDIFDYNILLSNFGKNAPTSAPSPTSSGASPTPLAQSTEWTQDAHDAQRTGYTPEDPGDGNNWTFAWLWNSPVNGNPPKEGRAIIAGGKVYVPAGMSGLYALNLTNGSQAWNLRSTSFSAAAGYDAGYVYAGGGNGTLYKINASDGTVVGSFVAGVALNKSVLLVGNYIYVVSDSGKLFKLDKANLILVWQYDSGSTSATPPAYSSSRDAIIFGTNDLYIHAVNNGDGSRKWRVKPHPNSAGDPLITVNQTISGTKVGTQLDLGWPVVAEQHGIVFIRMQLPPDYMGAYPSTNGVMPNDFATLRNWLINNPKNKNLFALNLDDGTEKFVPAVGYGSTEDMISTRAEGYGVMGSMPVVKKISNGPEVAYIQFRNGQTTPTVDWRWDGHMGEMVLDNTTVSGLAAGDLRFIKMSKYGSEGGNSYVHIVDEETPLTVAANTIFNAHWAASTSVRMGPWSASGGLTLSIPVTTTNNPPVIRALKNCSTPENLGPHKTSCGLSYVTDGGRYFDGPGFWHYLNQADPPGWKFGSNTAGTSYSAGFLPRYTYVSGGYVIVQDNGGDLLVLKHQ